MLLAGMSWGVLQVFWGEGVEGMSWEGVDTPNPPAIQTLAQVLVDGKKYCICITQFYCIKRRPIYIFNTRQIRQPNKNNISFDGVHVSFANFSITISSNYDSTCFMYQSEFKLTISHIVIKLAVSLKRLFVLFRTQNQAARPTNTSS